MAKSEKNAGVVATLSVEGFSGSITVLEFQANESISALFEIKVLFAAPVARPPEGGRGATPPEPAALTGQQACLLLETPGSARPLHGMVREAANLGRTPDGARSLHRVTLAPAAYRLTLGRRHRVFQRKTLLQIVSALLGRARIPHRVRTRGNRQPPAHRFRVQYGESDWAFINRLLEEEGFFYYFTHRADGHVMQIVDSVALAPAITGDPALPHRPPAMSMSVGEHVFDFARQSRLRPGRVRLDDYNPERPALDLRAATPEEGGAPAVHEYPGGHTCPRQGKALSRVRLHAERAAAEEGTGQSDCPRLSAGRWFSLAGAAGAAGTSGDHLLTHLEHRGRKGAPLEAARTADDRLTYENSFRCVPRATRFRPPRITPRPVVEGVHTAVVAGDADEEVYTDKLGRVKVRFRWDDASDGGDQSSCWVRVSQLMAGAGWGALWIPRVGQEVVVSFEQGDPDRPLITGSLYHAHHLPPFGQPGHKTRSGFRTSSCPGGEGHNELSFEDRRGAEVLRLRAQRELREAVGQDRVARAGRDHKTTVVRNQEAVVEQGNRVVSVLQGDLTEDVAGERMTSAGGGRTSTTTGGDDVVKVQGASRRVLVSDGDHSLTVSGSALTRVKDGSYTVEVGGPMFVVRCGAAELRLERSGAIRLVGASGSIELDAAGKVDISGSLVEING